MTGPVSPQSFVTLIVAVMKARPTRDHLTSELEARGRSSDAEKEQNCALTAFVKWLRATGHGASRCRPSTIRPVPKVQVDDVVDVDDTGPRRGSIQQTGVVVGDHMESKLVVKPPDLRPFRSVAVDVAWFAGSAATAFGVVDLFRTGSLSAIERILVTTEGRVNFIVAGAIGLIVGRALRGPRTQ